MKQLVKKSGFLYFLFVFTIAVIAGCNTNEQDLTKEESELTEATNGFPVSFVDDANREITIETRPETIVSLQPSNTEIAYALGLGSKMVGVTDFCNYPPEALDVEKIGAQEINVELILSLLPDLILATDYHFHNYADTFNQFEEAGINVVVIGNATSFTDVYNQIRLIGTGTGTFEEAENVIHKMTDRLDVLKQKATGVTHQKKVWVEVSPAPDIYTTGKGTFIHEMLDTIEAINVAGEQEGWIKLTEEEVVRLQPDFIITTYGYYVENAKDAVLKREGWSEVPAIQQERVFDVDSDTVTRPGPRLIEGVETLATLIYPEIFE